ncbi:unnamed protein product [Arabidopsis arenosa]|uniref:Palmitoyl-protein thioesterase 1-like n=1 Tax=Arabidopsis arenosa TaxID=38785 RepID=A0A8S2A9Q4_ARAAE|nr:unnamed protein product [Arabidopsis arenosa]
MGKKRFSIAVAVTFLSLVHIVVSVPFIMLHGISAECSDHTNSNFPRLLSNLSGSRGFCVEIGNGKSDSWLMPLTKQVEIVCDKGNLVARGLIEFCDDGPPVYNYVSLAGPHAGESSVPFCGDHLAPSGYIKIPTDIPEYMKSSKYLPKLNNEIPNERNSTYKERFTRLKNLVLIMFQNDTVIVPKESSWFGFYQDGNYTSQPPLLSAQQTKLYTEDWIGLKTLDVAGKVKFVSLPGGHLQIATTDVIKYVVPYLQNQPS